MKGKILDIKKGSFTGKKGEDVPKWEILVEIGPDKKRKYTCFQHHADELKVGAEVEYEEKNAGTYEDSEGITHDKWKMILPAKDKGYGGGGGRPRASEATMIMAYAKDLCVGRMGTPKGIGDVDPTTWTIDSFKRLMVALREAEKEG